MKFTEQQKNRIKKLIVALRSGKYKKTTNVLRLTDQEGNDSFCFWGVGCEVYRTTTKNGIFKWQDNLFFDTRNKTSWYAMTPSEVISYYGLNEMDLLLKNDAKKLSFKQIANYLERLINKN